MSKDLRHFMENTMRITYILVYRISVFDPEIKIQLAKRAEVFINAYSGVRAYSHRRDCGSGATGCCPAGRLVSLRLFRT